MATCTDQAIDHLNELGYNAIKLPREGITPLTILSRDPKTSISSIYGNVTDIIANPVPSLPKVFENLQAGTISGLRTNKLELKFGISILNDLLSALGGKRAGIESVFGKASTIEFEYENVQYDTVMPASVTKFLRGANPSIDQDFIPQFNEQGEAYIIIDVLKSNSFGIRLYQDSEGGIDINLDAIKNVVGLNSKISVEKKVDTKISFNGSQALGFGFKACPIWVETVGGVLKFRLNPNTNQGVALRGSTESSTEPTLDDENELTPVLIAPNQLMELA
ncbi:gasdermin [Nostoc sp.]|uniref:gasdermin n=1 Tax=Nostoc sp. TaxID=1180 RepID=UPI002FFC9496